MVLGFVDIGGYGRVTHTQQPITLNVSRITHHVSVFLISSRKPQFPIGSSANGRRDAERNSPVACAVERYNPVWMLPPPMRALRATRDCPGRSRAGSGPRLRDLGRAE